MISTVTPGLTRRWVVGQVPAGEEVVGLIRPEHVTVSPALGETAPTSARNAFPGRITRIIQLEGDLDNEQRQRLLEISNRCPVHKTLQEEIIIQTMLIK